MADPSTLDDINRTTSTIACLGQTTRNATARIAIYNHGGLIEHNNYYGEYILFQLTVDEFEQFV